MSNAGPGRREVAHRIFAAEYDDASLEYAESDEERAPNYVVTPSGARINRLFVVGVLTAVEQVNEDTVRARIADPTGAFVVYAGQYQPDELAALQSLEAPAFVAVTGKANTFSPEGSDRVLTSVRPESVTEVDAETRDRWVVATAEHTLGRVQTAAGALDRDERGAELRTALLRDGIEPGLAEGTARAIDHYGTTAGYLDALRDLATQALEVVADERSEVEPLDLAPGEGDGAVDAGDLEALLGEERLGATRAASDVDPEAFVDDDAGADEAPSDASEQAEGDEEAERADAEPETSERAVEETASDAERARDGGEESPGADPETSEAAVEETAADAEAAATDERTADEEPATDEEGAAEEGDVAGGGGADDIDEADDEELYEVGEEEREQIEEEYGVGFQNGTEVDPAGEAGIETDDEPPTDEPSDAESAEEEPSDAESPEEKLSDDEPSEDEPSEESESPAGGEATEDGDSTSDDADGADGSAEADDEDAGEAEAALEDVLLEEMSALDDGDGADRQALVDAVEAETGADVGDVDDAIDDLLMSGQCYEPSEGKLKPI